MEVPRSDLVDEITSELGVARCRMAAASVISTMKVERPEARSSEAPIRVSTRSIGPIVASSRRDEAPGGHDHRQRGLSHVVLLPPMFGLVRITQLRLLSSRRSFGMNWSTRDSITGCRAPASLKAGSGVNTGRESDSVPARSAKLARTSSSASAAPALRKPSSAGKPVLQFLEQTLLGCQRTVIAASALSSNVFSSVVM